MSHQPSAADNARSTTSDAVHKVADILDPSEESSKLGPKGREVTQDIQGTKIVKGSYKDQLNQAAYDGRKALQIEESLVEKAASYIPGCTKLHNAIFRRTANESVGKDGTRAKDDSKPPTRPENDAQVEEFLKDQYDSKDDPEMAKLKKEGKA